MEDHRVIKDDMERKVGDLGDPLQPKGRLGRLNGLIQDKAASCVNQPLVSSPGTKTLFVAMQYLALVLPGGILVIIPLNYLSV